MILNRPLLSVSLAFSLALLSPALLQPAQAQDTHAASRALASVSATEIEQATYTGGDLPPGQSALTAKVQILLDRSGISPGVVDGWRGGMSESAIKAFQRRAGLRVNGIMDHAVWELLQAYASEPVTGQYTITEDDATGLVDNIPTDYAQKANMTSQGYTSIVEKLSERFHMDDKFLVKMNPGIDFVPGATIQMTVPAKPIRATVTRIIVDKQTRRVAAYDANGRLVADYPATVGSDATPSPHGTHTVDAVALNPTYTYNPARNFKQGENDRVLIVPPGPNGPVGTVWIDLSQPTYGIHGTATPSRLFVNQSYGCVRLTNWDAWELAHMVKSKVTTVEFLDPGVSIADVTGGAAPVAATSAPAVIAATRPPMRSPTLAATIAAMTSQTNTDAATTSVAPVVAGEIAAGAVAAAVTPAIPVAVEAPVTQPAVQPVVEPPLVGVSIPDEPEYPSDPDTMLPETLPGEQPGTVILAPQPLPGTP